jgi:hypothetical protein
MRDFMSSMMTQIEKQKYEVLALAALIACVVTVWVSLFRAFY